MAQMAGSKTYIVEHLDPELGHWSALEYIAIAKELSAAKAKFYLTSVHIKLRLPSILRYAPDVHVEHRSVEEIFAEQKSRVCLLDPAAKQELSPEDGDRFDAFLFGGILGQCLLQPMLANPLTELLCRR